MKKLAALRNFLLALGIDRKKIDKLTTDECDAIIAVVENYFVEGATKAGDPNQLKIEDETIKGKK